MSRDALRSKDYTNNSIDSNKIIDGSIEVNNIKRIDNGDESGINAETLPYSHTALSPTIKDKIDAIVSVLNYITETFSGDGVSSTFDLSYKVNIATPFFVFVSGVYQHYGNLNDYIFVNNNMTLSFNYVPEDYIPITIIYQKGE